MTQSESISGDSFPDWELERTKRRRWILAYAATGGIGAELGVFRGHFSEVIAQELAPRRLFLVDPWRKLGARFNWGEDPYTNYNRLTTFEALADTKRRLAPYGRTTETLFIETSSIDFCINFWMFSGEKLDFVYLDTTHNYPDSMRELNAIDKVLKDTGLILGDDWHPDPYSQHHGLFRAVHDFMRTHPYQLVAAGPEAQFCLRRRPAYGS